MACKRALFGISDVYNGLCNACMIEARERKRVACFIVNYNMPERAEALYKFLSVRAGYPTDVYLIDNGSDQVPKAEHTNIELPKNIQTTGGWLEGVEIARQSTYGYMAYMFFITSTELILGLSDNIVKKMVEVLYNDDTAVGVHPALTTDSTTAWEHLKARGGSYLRPTWFIDNIASMYRASFYDAVGGFDRKMIYAHGIDLELCYLARKRGNTLWVNEDVQVRKITDIGYTMGRMGMDAETRRQLATANMVEVLNDKYGVDWANLMYNGFVTPEML